MSAILLILLSLASPALAVEVKTASGDTVYLYEVAYPSAGIDRLDIYSFPMEVREDGVPIPTRVASDETDIVLVSHLATTVVPYSITYELVREVEPDSARITRRLGVREVVVQLGLIHGKSISYEGIRSDVCPKEAAAGDTLLTGPRRGQQRCASYLPMPSFAGLTTEALFDSIYTSRKTQIDDYAESIERKEAEEESEKSTYEEAMMAR